MPSATSYSFLPTIDIAPFLANPASPEAAKVISEVHSACCTAGFFQIVGHGVPRELQQASFDAAAKFFALSTEEKLRIDIHQSLGHRGYDRVGTQSYTADTLPDLKEV
jgi:isopenicillin N synthase-like dioxygenase